MVSRICHNYLDCREVFDFPSSYWMLWYNKTHNSRGNFQTCSRTQTTQVWRPSGKVHYSHRHRCVKYISLFLWQKLLLQNAQLNHETFHGISKIPLTCLLNSLWTSFLRLFAQYVYIIWVTLFPEFGNVNLHTHTV